MELYEITLHFPGTLGEGGFTLNSIEYYESAEKAIDTAKVIVASFVEPKPDYFYIEDGAGLTIWTDYPEEVKRAITYDLITSKPQIKPIDEPQEYE